MTFSVTAAALVAAAIPVGANAAESASAFVQNLGSQLVAIVDGPGSHEQQTTALAKVIDTNVDVDGVARFVLGRFWRLASAQQQSEYEALFRKVLIDSITGPIGSYKGVRFTVGRTSARPEGQVVASTIASPTKAPAEVDWVVNTVNGSPKIVDVVAEGVSLRLKQRADYGSFIVKHHDSVQALLEALRRQASANG